MRLSHLTALAVMVALVGAMFVAMGSASAAALGDCAETGDGEANYLVVGDTCTIPVAADQVLTANSASSLAAVGLKDNLEKNTGDGVTGSTDSVLDGATYTVGNNGSGGTAGTPPSVLTVTARQPGVVTITDTNAAAGGTPDNDVFKIEVIDSPSIAIVFDDSDATVAAGTPVKVKLVVKGADNGEADLPAFNAAVSVPSTGLYFTSGNLQAGGSQEQTGLTGTSQRVFVGQVGAPGQANDIKFGGTVFDTAESDEPVLSTSGAPDGEYVVTATLPAAFGRFVANTTVTTTLTVGDAGAAIGSATLALDSGQKATVGKSEPVTLVVTSLNQLDALSNAGEVNTVTIFAPFGELTIKSPLSDDISATTMANQKNSIQISEAAGPGNDAVNNDDVGAVTKVEISSQGGKARAIDVYAIVIGKDGSKTTDTLTLTFTGSADGIALGDASGTLLDRMTDDNDLDVIAFSLSATDKAGNTIGNPTVIPTVTGPDGKDATSKFMLAQVDADPDKAGDDQGKITVGSKGTATTPLAVGEYTLKVKATTNSKVESTSTFSVVDVTSVNVVLEVSNSAPDKLGDTVTVTATVSADDEGTPVPEKTVVTFTASDITSSNDHVLVSSTGMNQQSPKTKNGVATAKFIAVGAGNAVISVVTAGGGNVTVITSTAGMTEPEAMPEEEAGLSCLSSLSGFSTWTCDVEASASEIFDWISSRGATALHLNSNRMWVRYSVVDGAMVPGSSDFMVTKSDILYISN